MKQYILPDGKEIDVNDQFQINDQKYYAGYLLNLSDDQIKTLGIIINILPDPEPEPIPEPEPTPPNVYITGRQFLDRLAPEEYTLIIKTANQLLENNNPQLSMWVDKVRVSFSIKMDSEEVLEAKKFLISNNLIKQERADIIFALP